MAEEEIRMTDEQLADEIAALVGTAPTGEEKHSVHNFLHNVAIALDTTKVGNLSAEEVGTPKLPQRTYKELALFCSDVANMGYFSQYFLKKAEILTSTSLSKDAKLISLAIMTRKEIADVSEKPRAENRGWFKRRSGRTSEQTQT